MVPPNADRTAHAAPPQNSRLVVFTVFMRILYQIRGNRAAPMQDALSSLRPLRLESLGLLDRDGLIDAKIALRCFVVNSVIPIEIVAIDKI